MIISPLGQLIYVIHVLLVKLIGFSLVYQILELKILLSLRILMYGVLLHYCLMKDRYYIHFLDDFSRFTWIYPLQTKSKAKAVFVQFHAMAERMFNKKLIC